MLYIKKMPYSYSYNQYFTAYWYYKTLNLSVNKKNPKRTVSVYKCEEFLFPELLFLLKSWRRLPIDTFSYFGRKKKWFPSHRKLTRLKTQAHGQMMCWRRGIRELVKISHWQRTRQKKLGIKRPLNTKLLLLQCLKCISLWECGRKMQFADCYYIHMHLSKTCHILKKYFAVL